MAPRIALACALLSSTELEIAAPGGQATNMTRAVQTITQVLYLRTSDVLNTDPIPMWHGNEIIRVGGEGSLSAGKYLLGAGKVFRNTEN